MIDVSQDQIKQWVAELRSGKHKQTMVTMCRVNTITNERSYCCLGVLAEHILRYDKRVYSPNVAVIGYIHPVSHHLLTALPEALPPEVELKLSTMNDNGKSFVEIADWIEANYKDGEWNVQA